MNMKIQVDNLDRFLNTIQKHTAKTLIGADQFWETVSSNVHNTLDSATNYPPYNIKQLSEDEYSIEFAIAGFTKNDVEITQEKNILTISTIKESDISVDDNLEVTFIHRGISQRSFNRKFTLTEYIKVRSAIMENGMLTISLDRNIPKSEKVHSIKIT